jgi:hypothetical protein
MLRKWGLACLGAIWVASHAGTALAQVERASAQRAESRDQQKDTRDSALQIVNGGFEDTRTPSRPFGWMPLQHVGDISYKFEHDNETATEGKRSFRIHRFAVQAYGTIKQTIVLPPQNKYRKLELTASLKSKGTDGEGWCLIASVNAGPIQFIRQYKSTPLLGDNDWRRVKLEIPIEKGDTDIAIGATLLGDGTGWIDDVKLREIE